MNRYFLTGAVILACNCFFSTIAYTCVPIDVYIGDWRKYVGVSSSYAEKTVSVTANVVSGGPATESSWDWTWPSGLECDEYDIERNQYDSIAEFWSYTTGRYTVWAYAENASYSYDDDWADVYVVDVSLSGGGHLALNGDPMEINISLLPSELFNGTVDLTATGGITVYYDQQMTIPVSLPASWSVARGQVPSSVWVQGTSASSSVNDASLDISYSNYSPPVDTGTAEFTVFDAEILGVDPNAIAYGGGGATINYKITPNSGWSPSEVKLIIGNNIRTLYPGEGVGEQEEYWDGKTNGDSWAETGEYYVKLEVSGSGTVSDTFFKPVTVVDIAVKITSPENFPYYLKTGVVGDLVHRMYCVPTPLDSSEEACIWEVVSGPGFMDLYNPQVIIEVDKITHTIDFRAYATGTYIVKVTYTRDGASVSDTSGDIIAVDYFIGAADPRRVAVNYDDDDEDSVGDTFDGFNGDSQWGNDDDLNPDENDLVMICPRVFTEQPNDIVRLTVLTGTDCIKIWSSPDKQDRIIPYPNNDNKYFNEWPAKDLPQELWVEGIKNGIDKQITISYTGKANPNGDQSVTPTAGIELTVVEVDMDMEGVQDDKDQYWAETHEIHPGGFIPVGQLEHLKLYEVLPNEIIGIVAFDVIAGGSKVAIYDNPQGTGSPIELPAYYSTPSGIPMNNVLDDLYVKGIEASDQPRDVILRYLDFTTGFSDVIKLTVYDVAVTFKKFMDNAEIEDCPLPNGGKRIFPGKISHDDNYPERRKIVSVVATITPPLPDRHVYFKSFDVDDPSDIDPDIDGPDNKGGIGYITSTGEPTDSQGRAIKEFEVGMYPGDNYRIAASGVQSLLDPPYMTQTAADNAFPPDGVKLSKMLTVFRKLWIEQDSMGAVVSTGPEKNFVSGTGATYSPIPPVTTRVDLGLQLPDEFRENDHFNMGGLFKPANWPLAVVVHDTVLHTFSNDTIDVPGNLTTAAASFDLYDDDYSLTLTPHITLPAYPTLGLIEYDYKKAYIQPVYLPGHTVIPFDRNMEIDDVNWGNNFSNPSSSGFWSTLVTSGYQSHYAHDGDPSYQNWMGEAYSSPNYCVVYLETTRSSLKDDWTIMAHEVAHTGGLDHCHNPYCFMNIDVVGGTPQGGNYLCDDHISELRSKSNNW